ncbi:cysteine hydrolase family protein [Brucella oryzae]|uniref:Cysteine hydrolase n=1 Tax=Brucella oryzae TaxID=335286 RepID=A0A2S7IWM2_9HYPH|nr:isochorismatase family cysteine hydrolase [Brucella oryzae]PQA72401.1 cysteine hydrolase [Brucella oryzae]
MTEFSIEFAGENIRRSSDYKAGQTAFLLVDMQRIWAEPGADPVHPQGEDTPFMQRLWSTVIPNQKRLLDAFRKADQNVLHTIIESLTADGRDRSLDHKLSDMHVPKGDPMGAIIEPLAPAENEIILPKTSSGVFNSTNIDYVLRNLNTRFLIIAGIVTDQCVDMAVRDAADRGYLVTLVEDACATYTDERHRAALRAFGGYCWITTTDEVVRRIDAMGKAQ